MADKFQLPFDPSPFHNLDELALLARQDYNLGHKGDWFGNFRGGLYGFFARIYGLQVHYNSVHAWIPRLRHPNEDEYHLSSIFFHMDSAIECLVFALNALGYAISENDFLDITDEAALKRVSPWNMLGSANRTPLPGYKECFGCIQEHWNLHRELIDTIVEQHDVSKHRSTIYTGGKYRSDPPPGFFESLGLPEDHPDRFQFSPAEQMVLHPEPKRPYVERDPAGYQDLQTVEGVAERFCQFINESGSLVLRDAMKSVPLNYRRFLSNTRIVYLTDIDLFEDADCSIRRENLIGVMLGVDVECVGPKKGNVAPTERLSYYKAGKPGKGCS